MDFNSMGSFDAQNDIRKSGIDTSKGELKAATIRTTAPFLDLLTHVAEVMGMSRQAFMSKIIEQMAAEAAAEYLSGYAEYMNSDDVDSSMFASVSVSDNIDKDLLATFVKQVDNNLLRMRLDAEGVNTLPSDHPLKVEYFEKYVRPTLKNMTIMPKVETK